MSPVKRFLLIFLVVYCVGAGFGIFMWGPPGVSAEYVKENRAAHEHYHETLSSAWYKHYQQSPEANPLNESQAANLAFVEEYAERPDFKAEEHRAHMFEMYFEFYNAIAFIVFAVGLAWKPALGLIDGAIAEHRERLDSAQAAREDAALLKREAEARVQDLPEETARINEQAQAAAKREQTEIEEATESVVAHLVSEIEGRKQLEARRAAMAARKEIVTKAVAAAEQGLRDSMTPEREHAFIEQFGEGLEEAL